MSGVRLRPLEGLRPEVVEAWRRLGSASAQACPFSEADYALPSAARLELGRSSQLLSVEHAGQMLFALPVRHVHRWGALPLLALAGWDHDYSFLGAPLLAPGREAEAWQGALLGLTRRRVGTLLLPQHPREGPSADGLARAARTLGLHQHHLATYERAVVHRRPSEDYLDGRVSSTSRKGLRRHRRRLGETAGEVRVVDRSGTVEGLDIFLRLEAGGWKGRSGSAMAVRPGHAAMLRSVVDAWGARVHLLTLEAGQTPVAAQLNIRSGSTLFTCKIAYDEQFSRFSPGLQLELEALSEFHQDMGLDLLDSCTEPGHAMSERLFPDRRSLSTTAIPLTRAGRLGLAGFQALGRGGRLWSRTQARFTARRPATTAAPSG